MNEAALANLLAVAVLVSVLGLGCTGQQGGDRPKTVRVTGTVTHSGEPVEGATVAFQSAGGSKSAIGVTDADGKYTLTTFESGDGAVPGEYQVKICKYQVETSQAVDESSPDYVPPAEGEQSAPPENLLPGKYADPTTSGLTATVSESGGDSFDFSLEG